jgi:serine/threonine protein kinase
MKPDNFMMGIN